MLMISSGKVNLNLKRTVVSKIRSILQVGKESNQAFKYCGINLEHNDDSMTYLHQDSYTDSLKPIEITAGMITKILSLVLIIYTRNQTKLHLSKYT